MFCCCLQTYNLNVKLEGMGLVLGQSWMINRHILFCPPIIMYCEVCCCLHIHLVVNVLVTGLVLGQSLMFIYTVGILLYANIPIIMYYGSALLLFTCKLHCLQTLEHYECTLGNQSLGICEVSYTYLLGCLRYQEKHVKDVVCCLQTCNSDVYVVVMGLVL